MHKTKKEKTCKEINIRKTTGNEWLNLKWKSRNDRKWKGRIHSNLIPARDAWRVQTKPCAHQDPGKGAVKESNSIGQ